MPGAAPVGPADTNTNRQPPQAAAANNHSPFIGPAPNPIPVGPTPNPTQQSGAPTKTRIELEAEIKELRNTLMRQQENWFVHLETSSPRKGSKVEVIVQDGYTGTPFDISIPLAVDEAIRGYKFISYIKLTQDALCMTDDSGDQYVLALSDGKITSTVTKWDEHTISTVEYPSISRTIKEHIATYHGKALGACWRQHHKNVSYLSGEFGFTIGLEYCIKTQCWIADDNKIDFSILDQIRLLVVQEQIHAASIASLKQTFSAISGNTESLKKAESLCFHCGTYGHLPDSCAAPKTVTGRVPFQITNINNTGKKTLVSTTGVPVCYKFAGSSKCSLPMCAYFYGCSVCGALTHGAADYSHCNK
ncbi:hypothetical protein BT96DRAFT_941644 [Gymnopus androsaceus JB14]|uniref:CCHC-type domain-containing protein n=1 Tax=Gymnopus androsaceus JB14 TaxID=1447944 RepID=A0A6A4HI18_9AGAR|nr:hypothetical protein BT96DRAFT_941644 [Gymnopus androsaceus JB14]